MSTTPAKSSTNNPTPGKNGGYAEPKPDQKRGDQAEDAFDADFEQGRETTRERDEEPAPPLPMPERRT